MTIEVNGLLIEALVSDPSEGLAVNSLFLEALVSPNPAPPDPYSDLIITDDILDSTKTIDLNRFRKVYPFILREEQKYSELLLASFSTFIVEAGAVYFVSSSQRSYTLKGTYSGNPAVIVTPVDSYGSGSANVNVFVSSISTDASVPPLTTITIDSSAPFSGEVHFHVFQIE